MQMQDAVDLITFHSSSSSFTLSSRSLADGLTVGTDKMRIQLIIVVHSVAFISLVHGFSTARPTTAYNATSYEEMTATVSTVQKERATSVTSYEEMTVTLSTVQNETATSVTDLLPVQHSLAVIAGSSFRFLCSAPSRKRFRWEYCPFGSRTCKRIYNGAKINKDFPRAATSSVTNCKGRSCTFNVDDFQLDDVGYLNCVLSGVAKTCWSITVLESEPMCSTNATLPWNAVNASDPIEIQCSVRYRGIWTPNFECAPHLPGTPISNTSSDTVTYKRVIAASDIEDFTELICTMNFTLVTDYQSITPSDLSTEPEKPVYNFVWNASEWLETYTAVTATLSVTSLSTLLWNNITVTDKYQQRTPEKVERSSSTTGASLMTYFTTVIFVTLMTVAVVVIIALVCYYRRRMRKVAELNPTTSTTTEMRALPQVPGPDIQANILRQAAGRLRVGLPQPHPSGEDDGHYTDIHSIFRGRVGGRGAVQSIIDDDGHYSDIHGIIPSRHASVRRRSSGGYEHYIDIDREDQPAADPRTGDQAAARSRSYEGLATLRQPQRPHDYAGLAAGQAAASSEGSRRGNGYEGLNPADMEPIQVPYPPDHYTGLGIVQAPGSGLDPHGYIEVIADPQYEHQPQSEGSRRGNGYEGLNHADMEPIQVHRPPDHYAGLGRIQAPRSGLDPHGYLEVIADQEYEDNPQSEGLGTEATGSELDPHGYIEVIADPEYENQPQEEGNGVDGNAVASAAFTEPSSLHHSADGDDEHRGQSLPVATGDEDLEEQAAGNKKSGSGYESLDAREVEEARLRAQQPSVYAGLHAENLEDLYSMPKKKKR